MKSIIQAVAIAAVLAAPVASFAQSNGPVTRAEVRQQLVQVERAGYSPANNDPSYPNNIQAAEHRAGLNNVSNSAGGVAYGTSQAGYSAAPSAAAQKSMFSHR